MCEKSFYFIIGSILHDHDQCTTVFMFHYFIFLVFSENNFINRVSYFKEI